MDNNVVEVMLKAKVDTSDVNKDMSQIANKASERLEKTIKGIEDNVSKRIKDLNADVAKLDAGKDLDLFGKATNAIELFNTRLEEIKNSTSIDSVTAQAFKFEKTLAGTAREILNLKNDLEKLQAMESQKNFIEEKFGGVEGITQKIEELKVDLDKLNESIYKGGSNGPDTRFVGAMSSWSTAIDTYRQTLQALQKERDELMQSPEKGTQAWQTELEGVNKEIQSITSSLGNASKEFYRVGREHGFGTTKEDIREAYTNLSEYVNKAKELTALQAILSNKASESTAFSSISSIMSQLGELSQTFDNAEKNIRGVANSMSEVNEQTSRAASSGRRVGDEYAHLRAEIRAGERFMAQFYTVCMDVVRASKMIVNVYKKIFSVIKQVLGVIKKMRDHIKKTSDEHAKNWKQMLRDILRYSLGIRSLFALFRRLRRYIREAFEAMGSQIPEVQAMLDNLSSSLGMLKGSLATAFEPILSAIAPILDILIEKLSTALTYIGMFFAALTGRGYVYKATKAIKGVTDAAKEMNKQLQGFDELNNLTSQKDKGGGESPLANFEKVDIPDWIKKIADYIRDLFNKIMAPIKEAWRKVGDYVKAAWKRAFYAVKALLMDIIDDFVRAWTEKGEMIATRVFEIVGDIGNIIANIADALRAAWEYNDNGYKIWCAILDIIQKVLDGIRRITIDMVRWTRTLDLTPAMTAFREWLESLVPVVDTVMYVLYDFWNHALKPILNWAFNGENSGIARFFKILKDFNDKLDLEKIRNDLDLIWQAVGRFGVSIGDGLLKFMERMLGYLAEWLNSDDFTEWCQKVADFLDNIDADEIADDLEQVYRIIKNIAEWTWKAIKYFLDHKDEILDALEWISEHISLILGLMVGGKLIIDVGRLIAEFVRLKTFFKAAGALQTIAEGGASAAGAAAGTSFLSKFMENIVGAGTALETFLTTDVATLASAGAGSLALTIGTALVGGILSFLAGSEIGIKIGEALWPEDMELYQKYEGVAGKIDLIKDSWQALVDFIDLIDLKEKMFGWLPTAEEMGEKGTAIIEGLKSGMLAALETIGTAISPGLKGIIDLVKTIFLIASPSKVMEDIGMNIVQGLIDGWNNNIDKIFTAITDFGNKIIEKFNTVKSKVTTLFSNMVSAIRAILSGLASTVSSTLSAIGSKISSAVSNLKSKVNNVVSSANSKFHVNIPHLAQGAVIPPNNEFLAVLGDQKSGTNIESPLSTMVEAFNQANKGGSEAELALLQEQNDLLRQLLQKEFGITEGAIFRAVRTQNSQFMKQNGVSAFA